MGAIYDLSPSEYAMVLRSVKSVFPHCGLIRISPSDTVVLASMAPLVPTAEDLDLVQADIERLPDVRHDLKTYFGTDDVRSLMLSHFFFDETRFERLLDMDRESTLLNTDSNLKLEFEAANRLFAEDADLDGHLARRWIRKSSWTCLSAGDARPEMFRPCKLRSCCS